MLLKQCAISVTTVAVLLLGGCSRPVTNPSASNVPAPPEKSTAPQIVAAKTALGPMYAVARNWSRDVVVLRMTAKEVPGFKNEDGKAAMWEAAFASPSLRQYRVFTYSVAAVPPDIHKGVLAGLEMPWSGATRDAMPVDLSMFNVDSDAAYKAASSEAADWLNKNPGIQLSSLEIGDTYKSQDPVWYVKWGNKKSGYAALVDASSGKILKHL